MRISKNAEIQEIVGLPRQHDVQRPLFALLNAAKPG